METILKRLDMLKQGDDYCLGAKGIPQHLLCSKSKEEMIKEIMVIIVDLATVLTTLESQQ